MLLVDAANVVGARADGWWRDRPGAAARLVGDLRGAVAAGHLEPPVVVVLEGAARQGAPEGEEGGVRVVHAEGSGDDTLVDLAAVTVTDAATDGATDGATLLVTADRALRDRAARAGARSVGPRWLLDHLS